MEAELLMLATSGATTMVGLMVSESWALARGRLVTLFGRNGPESESEVEEDLETSQRELTEAREAGDEVAAADVEAEWRARLRRLLRSDPTAAEELRALLAELAPLVETQPAVSVHNTISGGTQAGPVFQGHNFSGVTIHASTTTQPPGNGSRQD